MTEPVYSQGIIAALEAENAKLKRAFHPVLESVQAMIDVGWHFPLERPSCPHIDNPIYHVVNAAWKAMQELNRVEGRK